MTNNTQSQPTPNMILLNYLSNNIITPGSTLLDVGCGPRLYSNPFKKTCKEILCVDAWAKIKPDVVADLEKERIQDVVDGQRYDYIFMIDFIEHLDKQAGLDLIEDCKSICDKKIFLLTPMEEIWNDNHHNVMNKDLWSYGNAYDHHKSVWHPEDFPGWTPVNVHKKFRSFYTGVWEAS